MSDIEAGARAQIIKELQPYCHIVEECDVTGAYGDGRVDVLAVPRCKELSDLSLAIEAKIRGEGGIKSGHWVKQCADYVGTQPRNGAPRIAAAFLWFPAIVEPEYIGPRDNEYGRGRHVGNVEGKEWGIIEAAEQFRVGYAKNYKDGISLRIGPNTLLHPGREGWSSHARTLLTCRRKIMGRRLTLDEQWDAETKAAMYVQSHFSHKARKHALAVPPEAWPELVRNRRTVAERLGPFCVALASYVEDAEMTGTWLGYGSKEAYLREGIGVDPCLIDWANAVIQVINGTYCINENAEQ